MRVFQYLSGWKRFLSGGASPEAASEKDSSIERGEESRLSGRLLSYKDPLTYRRVGLDELVTSPDNVIWLERPSEPHNPNFQFRVFHDWTTRPVVSPEIAPRPPPIKSAVYIMARSDVALSGYRTIIGRDGYYNLDEIFPTKESEATATAWLGHPEIYGHEWVGFKGTDVPGVFRLDTSGKRFSEITEPVISVSSNEAPNYGSFLYRIFPKLVHVAKLPDSLKILIPNYIPTLTSYLELVGIDLSRIIPQRLDHIYFLKRAVVPSMRNRSLWLDDETLSFYDDLRERYGAAQSGRRLYVSRRNLSSSFASTGRFMTNEVDLIEELERRGFEIVEPEALSAREQIALFSSASVIVGAGGSALFNAVFCRPGTKLIHIEAEPHWARGHASLFASRGLDFGLFEGTPSSYDFSRFHLPFSVDVPRLKKRLDSFL